MVKCPLSLDNSNAKSSQTSEGKETRILNKQLVGKTEPPWGKEGASDWRNSYVQYLTIPFRTGVTMFARHIQFNYEQKVL